VRRECRNHYIAEPEAIEHLDRIRGALSRGGVQAESEERSGAARLRFAADVSGTGECAVCDRLRGALRPGSVPSLGMVATAAERHGKIIHDQRCQPFHFHPFPLETHLKHPRLMWYSGNRIKRDREDKEYYP
jgi:hypothetical protein